MMPTTPVLFAAGVGALSFFILVLLCRRGRRNSESRKLAKAKLHERQEHLRRTLNGECADKDCPHPHNKCRNHEVEYDVMETGLRFANSSSDPSGFDASAPQCCGEKMLTCERMELRKCKECGSARSLAITGVDSSVGGLYNNWYAICPCCKTALRYVPCRNAWEPARKCGVPVELKIVDW